MPPIIFLFTDPAPTEIYTLSLHDALPICDRRHGGRVLPLRRRRRRAGPDQDRSAGTGEVAPGARRRPPRPVVLRGGGVMNRSEEHTSELQSQFHLVCRLLLEKKK